ncbi:hypothetical protein [Fibrobacter sp. UWH4]|uniref:hypothetical protein n=1 Tax=Fibrobacter sp. UWH4 TaxID=1896210 RepID=UPI0009240E2D|nr:hypothetical protein [Fibrobacter sp. UWH4]SHK20436.1 hypothetical protein SAMN05720762_10162 [Fibrobacter sp. UWH4]
MTNRDNENISLTLAEKGTPFKSIDCSTLPEFKESDYFITTKDPRFTLIERLRSVVFPSLPSECFIENDYSGILATDLFSLNTLLGSMIENKVVLFLNTHRPLWDDGNWEEYHFIRSNESFPDVRLVAKNGNENPKLGIELKSWFILSKEGEPSFRYATASEACDAGDLLCIIPWYLSNAVCGKPILTNPWVYSAKAASEAMKRYWLFERNTPEPMTLDERGVDTPKSIKPYMLNARDKTNYKPRSDGGKNFGRLARTGIMSQFVEETLKTDILGIPADNWRRFLKAHTDSKSLKAIQKNIASIVKIPKSENFAKIINELRCYIEGLPQF